MPPDKATVAQVLRDISLLLQMKGESVFRSRAYDTAADRIVGLGEDLGALVREGRLQEFPGIGQAIADKVSELVTTGKLAYFESLKAEFPPGVLELVRVPELGPKKALALARQLGVDGVDALEKACREGRVRQLSGFGEKSETKLLDGIALYRRTVNSRRLLGEALPVAERILESVKAAPGVIRASVGGSLRRRAETVGDVDLIASASEASAVFDAFSRAPEVAQLIGRGESKCSVRLHEKDLQVDLRVLPDEDFATALHHFTGSKA
ncbi:MAG TPA: helix-hairpin-helix domain-containing protein, partial [Myxococcaceae bacterium]|nr:helix-hairpin-helix domain-containing protein [Myxococcaceae bacterium]